VPDLSPDEVAELVRAADVSLLSIEADALVSEVLVLVVVVEPDSSITIKHGWSPGQSWITRRGMLESALDMHRIGSEDVVDDDDD
jgi:hypothetical protein